MSYSYEEIDGERVEVSVAADFHRMNRDFTNTYGFGLRVSSGTRTREEQAILYDNYLHHGGNLAAPPGYSNHEEDGPIGPRAIDIRDDGDDPGVTRRGTARDGWMSNNIGNYDFTNAGYGFSQVEAWHKEWQGQFGQISGGDVYNGGYAAGVSDIQTLANKLGANLDVDNIYGPATTAWVVSFQQAHGLDPDGIVGPITWAAMQSAAQPPTGSNQTSRPTEDIQRLVGATPDNDYGPETTARVKIWQAANGLDADGIWGPLSDAKGFPPLVIPPVVDGGTGLNMTSRPVSDIQKLVGVNPDNDYGPATTAAVKVWQAAHFLDADGIWGNASDGIGFPPAGSIFGVDYSFARPGGQLLKDRGVAFVGRYLAPLSNGKGIQQNEYAELYANGIEVFFIYEEDGQELLTGFEGGKRVAGVAESLRNILHYPAKPIYFNVDFDASDEQIPVIIEALQGIVKTIGIERVGLYGGYKVIKAAFDAGVIRWGFQTYAWSNGQWDSRAQLQQWANSQWNGTVDFTRAVARVYGQNPIEVTPVPDPTPTPDPDPTPTPDPTPDPSPGDKVTVTFSRDLLKQIRDEIDELLN